MEAEEEDSGFALFDDDGWDLSEALGFEVAFLEGRSVFRTFLGLSSCSVFRVDVSGVGSSNSATGMSSVATVM